MSKNQFKDTKQKITDQLTQLQAYRRANSLHAFTTWLTDLNEISPIHWFNLLGVTQVNAETYKQTIINALKNNQVSKGQAQQLTETLQLIDQHYQPDYRYLIFGHQTQATGQIVTDQNLAQRLNFLSNTLDHLKYHLMHTDLPHQLNQVNLKNKIPFKLLNHPRYQKFFQQVLPITTAKQTKNQMQTDFTKTATEQFNELIDNLPINHQDTTPDELQVSVAIDINDLQKYRDLKQQNPNTVIDTHTLKRIDAKNSQIIQALLQIKNLLFELKI